MSRHVMLDLETLSSSSRACIVAVGAWCFDTKDPEAGEAFYRLVNPLLPDNEDLEVSVETLFWWMQQSDAARNEIIKSKEADDLRTVLCDLNDWYYLMCEGRRPTELEWPVRSKAPIPVWGNGSDFDNVILFNAFDVCNLETPWSHRWNRCFHTLKDLFPDVEPPPKSGVEHNALDDAKWQAVYMSKIFQAAGLS